MFEKSLDKLKNLNKKFFWSICILLLIIVIDYIIYISGGTEGVFIHTMYIPIVIAAFIFELKGGVVTAILAGVTLGPFMTVNVPEGKMQEPGSCIFRIIFFIIMRLFIGELFHSIRQEKENQIIKSYKNILTGYPNGNKLKFDLNTMINVEEKISLIVFKIINLDNFNRYVDYTSGEKSILKLVETLEILFGKDNIYSVYTNELVVIMKGYKR